MESRLTTTWFLSTIIGSKLTNMSFFWINANGLYSNNMQILPRQFVTVNQKAIQGHQQHVDDRISQYYDGYDDIHQSWCPRVWKTPTTSQWVQEVTCTQYIESSIISRKKHGWPRIEKVLRQCHPTSEVSLIDWTPAAGNLEIVSRLFIPPQK